MTHLLIAALTGTLLLYLRGVKGSNLLFAASGDEDADMKIAPGSFSASRKTEDYSEAEAEARDYLRQKSAGNISLARALGEKYAALLMEEAKANFEPWPEGMADSLRAHHRLLLFSYVVNRVIADLSPNSILAHTALNVFYDELEEKAPRLDKHIRDMAAYSLYILCERSETCMEDEIGKIYARLCGDKGNKLLIEEGERHYRAYYDACSRLHQQTAYVEV